jgi:hypothetical protein
MLFFVLSLLAAWLAAIRTYPALSFATWQASACHHNRLRTPRLSESGMGIKRRLVKKPVKLFPVIFRQTCFLGRQVGLGPDDGESIERILSGCHSHQLHITDKRFAQRFIDDFGLEKLQVRLH